MQSSWIPQMITIVIVLILLAFFVDGVWGWLGLILGLAVTAYLLSLR